jgi:hypothetical protein
LTSADIPPPAAAEVAVAQFAEPLLDELLLPLLPHPAASTAQPSAAAMAAPVFFLRTFSPYDLHDHDGFGTRASSRGSLKGNCTAIE